MDKTYSYEIQITKPAYHFIREQPELRNAFKRVQITDIRYGQGKETTKQPTMEYKLEMDRAPFEIIGTFIKSASAKIGYDAIITRGIEGHSTLDNNIKDFRRYLVQRSYKRRRCR